MSVLLRHPATVPALFSRSVEPPRRVKRKPLARPSGDCASLVLVVAWAAMVLIEVPLVDVAVAAAGIPLAR